MRETTPWATALEALFGRLRPHFKTEQTFDRAKAYLQGLLSSTGRKNTWQLAEILGNRTPYALQQFLYRSLWDADALRDDLRNEVEFPAGTLSVLTGLSHYSGIHKDNFVTNGSFFTESDYDLKEFDGYGTPLEFNFILGGTGVGLGLSLIMNINDSNPSTGFFVGIPFGLLRG